MPPKKKVSVPGAAPASAAAVAAAAPAPGVPGVGGKDDDICWYWAGDSDPSNPDKSQDVWVLFDADKNGKIEEAFKKGKKKVVVDKERFVDLNDWQQKRKDDEERRRAVFRSIGPLADLKRQTKAKQSAADKDEEEEEEEKEEEEEEEEQDEEERWEWAGDSKPGKSQDVWLPYNGPLSAKLAAALKTGKKKVKLNATYVAELGPDEDDWWQVRADDEDKRRRIRLVRPGAQPPQKKAKKAKAAAKPKKAAAAAKKPAKKKAKSDAVPEEEEEEAPEAPEASAPGPVVAPAVPGLAFTLKMSLQFPDNWRPLESMSYEEVEVPKGSQEWASLSVLMNGTIAPFHKNNTQNHAVPFSSFEVTRVVRVQNPILWVNYHNRCALMYKKLIEQFKSPDKIPAVAKVLTASAAPPPSPRNAAVNEHFLFHGLNHAHLDTITREGFNPRFCSLEGMFGSALYFAEHSSKANQYTHCGKCAMVGGTPGVNAGQQCECAAGDEACLLLCRVALGEALVERDYRGNAPGQFWHQLRTEPKKGATGHIYNSVVGESQQNYAHAALRLREYIVFEQTAVYPEYKIHYRRLK